jgi:hypothetical protein
MAHGMKSANLVEFMRGAFPPIQNKRNPISGVTSKRRKHGWVQRQSSDAIRRLNDGRGREATRVEGSVHGPARALCTKEATAMRGLSIKLIGLACRRSLGQQSRGVTRSLLTSRFQTQNPDW